MKLPIPQDWDGESWCRWSVCWPESESWEGLLRGFLSLPQRGWTWDQRTGSILAVQETGREITDLNLPLNGVFMACNDTELTTAFNDIALALRYLADRQFAKPCCGAEVSLSVTAGYAGQVTQPIGGNVIPIYGDSPPAVLPPEATFPEGFADVEEWNLHKCSVANMIFDGVMYTLGFLAGLDGVSITTLALLIGAGIAGILVVPPAGIAIMVGAVAALFGFMAMFLDIRNLMLEQRDDFICWMYEAESVSVLISIIADALDFIILAVGASGPIAAALKTVLLLLFNADTLNKLFDSTADYLYPGADCSGCAGCGECVDRLDADYNVIATLNVPNAWFTVSSHSEGPFHSVYLQVNSGSVEARFQNLVGWTLTGVSNNFEIGQDSVGSIHEGDDFAAFAAAAVGVFLEPAPGAPFRQWGLVSATAFTVDVQFAEPA